MTQIPAGWYPDPDTSQPEPRGQRYWDGQQWTAHVQQAPGQPTGSAPVYTPMAPYAGGVQVARATTPDGQQLAGWWIRVGAFLIDTVIVNAITAVLGFTWVRQVGDAYGDFISAALDTAETGGPGLADQADLMAEISAPLAALSVLGLLVSVIYHAGFLKWRAATPGKLALGLRVRLREIPGALSWATVLKRWVAQKGYAVLTIVPIIGSIVVIYPLLNALWPLWDGRKQALHDKVAATNVVRQRG